MEGCAELLQMMSGDHPVEPPLDDALSFKDMRDILEEKYGYKHCESTLASHIRKCRSDHWEKVKERFPNLA